MDLISMTDLELAQLSKDLDAELARRSLLASCADQVNAINEKVHQALEAEEPAPAEGHFRPWRQPHGAHDAYPIGKVVEHNDKVWTNTIMANVWEPGTHGWEETPGADPEPPAPEYPAWSAQATYVVGDRVSHLGSNWECLVAHGPEYLGTWAPGPSTATVWRLL